MPTRIPVAGWLNLAEQARAIAAEMHDLDAKRIMIEIADGYQAIAVRAGRRSLSFGGTRPATTADGNTNQVA
jgi:hypothetical protein